MVRNFKTIALKNGAKQLILTLKWPTAKDHGTGDTSLNTHVQSFHCPNTMEEERLSWENMLDEPAIVPNIQDDRPEFSGRSS